MTWVEEVREAVLTTPAGSVASYGEVGRHIGTGPRQVGRAMSLLGEDTGLPWWRVVHADGTPATCHEGRAPAPPAEEGAPVRLGRVDLEWARHRWGPP
ncbi:MGMT family protein [Streptomyces albidoflavus]|uniref:MGMT family protein n=1 Tax=Streptomyces albidoflavus TaxID=1886 RepID=UPI0033E44E01